MREAANAVEASVAESGQSAKKQVSTSIEIWKFMFGTTFPVHLLDDDNSKLANPIAQAQGTNPSSDGYAAGGNLEGLGSTGGRQVVDQTGNDYSRPVEVLSAPGVMNQDSSDEGSGAGAKSAGTLANAERGTLTEANFAQNKIKSDRSFSEDGQRVYSELAGTPIKTVDDLAGALRAGTIAPNQLPVDYVDMNWGSAYFEYTNFYCA